jgi:hypothetical protein
VPANLSFLDIFCGFADYTWLSAADISPAATGNGVIEFKSEGNGPIVSGGWLRTLPMIRDDHETKPARSRLMTNLRTLCSGVVGGYRPVARTKEPWHLEAWPSVRDGAVESAGHSTKETALRRSLWQLSLRCRHLTLQARLRLFGSRRARIRAGTASERGCC